MSKNKNRFFSKFAKWLFKASIRVAPVLFGILMAFSINQWNDQRKEKYKIESYLIKIQKEVNLNLQSLELDQDHRINITFPELTKAFEILLYNKADSLSLLKNSLPHLIEEPYFATYFPLIDEFLDQGYLSKLNDDKLDKYFKLLTYSRQQEKKNTKIENKQQIEIILPFVMNHMNLADLVENSSEYTSGGFTTDFADLMDNRELWNIICLKIDYDELIFSDVRLFIQVLNLIDSRINEIVQGNDLN